MQQLQGCMDPRMMQQLGGAENLMTMMKEMGKMDLVSRKTPRACCPPLCPLRPRRCEEDGGKMGPRESGGVSGRSLGPCALTPPPPPPQNGLGL